MEVFVKHYNADSRKNHNNSIEKKRKKEIEALQVLEANFINEPKINHYPFPKLISTEVCKIHDYCNTLILTHCGIDTIRNTKRIKTGKSIIQPIDLYNTVECIINNLSNINLKYGDIKGQNVCINEKGQVSLIDFDSYTISAKNIINSFYKKPNLNELKNSLYTSSYNKEFMYMRNIDKLKDFYNRFQKQPWSILYMF